MTSEAKLIPTSSQTVGPYFRIGLEYLIERTQSAATGSDTIAISGRVLDRDGAPVADAILEFWSASEADESVEPDANAIGCPDTFRRAATDVDGRYSALIRRPAALPFDAQRTQAPHLVALVFARGLLRHLISRVYFEDSAANDADPVLLEVPAERRGTLVGKLQGENAYVWDVVLQGTGETVFFAW